jgi:hypothetical protein
MRKTQWSSCEGFSLSAGLAGGLPFSSGEIIRAGDGGTSCATKSKDSPAASGLGQGEDWRCCYAGMRYGLRGHISGLGTNVSARHGRRKQSSDSISAREEYRPVIVLSLLVAWFLTVNNSSSRPRKYIVKHEKHCRVPNRSISLLN